jgi:hypothetical protein
MPSNVRYIYSLGVTFYGFFRVINTYIAYIESN